MVPVTGEESAEPAAEAGMASEGALERQPEPSSAAGPASAAANGATGVTGTALICTLHSALGCPCLGQQSLDTEHTLLRRLQL